MSDHKCAAGYNFSQPTSPEKKTAKAIPRPMPTWSWPEGRGSSGHLEKFCYQRQSSNLARAAVTPSYPGPHAEACLPLLWPLPLSSFQAGLFISRRFRMGWKARQAMLWCPGTYTGVDKHCLFASTRWVLAGNSKTKQHKT